MNETFSEKLAEAYRLGIRLVEEIEMAKKGWPNCLELKHLTTEYVE